VLISWLAGALILAAPAWAQTPSTWSGGAGDWQPCPQQGGDALWNTCPNYPNGDYDAVISGGPVSLSSANGDDESVVTLTINSGGTLTFDGGYLHVTGSSISNAGSISLSIGSLHIDGSSVTLSGSGSLSLQGSEAFIDGEPGEAANFINQQLISGQGSVGIGELEITNQGTISAAGGTLSVGPNTSGIVNTGTLEASSGATLELSYGESAPLTNTGGTIEALDGGVVEVQGPVITGGTLTTSGSGFIEIVGGNTATLNNLTNAGDFIVESAGSVSLEGAINNTGTFQLASTGGGTYIYINGNATLSGSGAVIMNSGGSNFISALESGSVLANQSTIEGVGSIVGSGWTIDNQSLINANSSGNTLDINGPVVNNTATLEASGGATLGIFSTINNAGGTIEALAGSVVLLQGNANIGGGTLKTSGSGTIQSYGGAVLNGTTNTVTNAGAITLSSSEELYLEGTIDNTGTITLNDTCLGLEGATTLTGSGKVIMNSNSCFLAFSESYTFTNESTIEGTGSIGDSNEMQIINGSSGSIIANQPGTLDIYSTSAGFTNDGKLIVDAGSTINIPNYFTNLSSGTLTGGTYQVTGTLQIPADITSNAGNITLTGTSSRILDPSSENALAGLTTNAVKGSFTLAGNQNLTTSGAFSNAGTMKVSTGSTFTVGGSGSYTQTGGKTTVDGTLTTSSTASFPGGSLFLPAAGSIKINGGSVFGNGGNLAANVTSNGTITPADSSTATGKLNVTGAYTQNSKGALDINLASASEFNQLFVSGAATLGGTLNIGLLNGFVPALNSTFEILTCAPCTGTFATVNGTAISGSEHFSVEYNSNNVTLQVVSGP